jgi:hypothetical protein
MVQPGQPVQARGRMSAQMSDLFNIVIFCTCFLNDYYYAFYRLTNHESKNTIQTLFSNGFRTIIPLS